MARFVASGLDVASQQKSFVSMLIAIAADKGLIDVNRPVGRS